MGRRSTAPADEELLDEDVHARLMRQNYRDVPEYVYAAVLLVFAAIGMIGVGVYPSQTSPVVMVFGIVVTLITLLPVGLVQAVTGIPVPTNVISEFIGGAFVSGNANGMFSDSAFSSGRALMSHSFDVFQDIWIYLLLPGYGILERSQIGSLL